MMVNRVVGQSDGAKKVSGRIVRALLGALLWPAILGGWIAFSAQEPRPPAAPVPAVEPHDPLGGKLCVDCHRRVAPPGVRCMLAKEDLCEFCHEIPVEGGIARLVESSEPLCLKCHNNDLTKDSFAHGPFAVGACMTCHNPHGGNIPGMLRVTGPEMCLECHDDMHPGITNADFRHKAALAECTDCHAPHMSEQRYMLTSAVPGLCTECHEEKVSEMQTSAVKHSPVTEEPACLNCHDPHAARESGLLLADGLDICLTCHDEPVESETEEFADMKQLLAANPYPHGPIQNRDCSGCHDSHGSPYFRLLTDQYPQSFYVPFFVSNYDLCFRCHDAALATEERITSATDFRDGERNLHFVHVNKASHGRTCRSCHAVHASANPKHIAATVPFGNWELPIKYEATEDGGSCAPGCHALQKYSRQSGESAKQ